MPREPAWLTSAAMDGGAQAASRERRPGHRSAKGGLVVPKRTSGDGAWATLTGEIQKNSKQSHAAWARARTASAAASTCSTVMPAIDAVSCLRSSHVGRNAAGGSTHTCPGP